MMIKDHSDCYENDRIITFHPIAVCPLSTHTL